MPWWTWTALAFCVAVIVASGLGALVGVRGLRRAQARGEVMAAAFEELMTKAEALEQRAALVEERGARVEAKLAQLDRSRQRLSVLTWALTDATSELTRLRGLLRK